MKIGKDDYYFISCVKSKKTNKDKASELYISTLYKGALNYALKHTKKENIFILSAKYGLLKLDDIIEPYDETLNTFTEKQKKIWAYKVYKQMQNYQIDFNKKTIFLAGKNYRKYLITKFKNGEAPLKKLSIGKQLAFYKKEKIKK